MKNTFPNIVGFLSSTESCIFPYEIAVDRTLSRVVVDKQPSKGKILSVEDGTLFFYNHLMNSELIQ